jgi:hypothetical protein
VGWAGERVSFEHEKEGRTPSEEFRGGISAHSELQRNFPCFIPRLEWDARKKNFLHLCHMRKRTSGVETAKPSPDCQHDSSPLLSENMKSVRS